MMVCEGNPWLTQEPGLQTFTLLWHWQMASSRPTHRSALKSLLVNISLYWLTGAALNRLMCLGSRI